MPGALPPAPMLVPGVGTVMWQRGTGAKDRVDIDALPYRIAMDWSPKSGGKNFAGLQTAEDLATFIVWYNSDARRGHGPPCVYEIIEDLNNTPTWLGVR